MGGLDLVEILVGPKGCGKTSLAVELAQADLELGRWHFAHDLTGTYVEGGLKYYESPEHFWKAVHLAREQRQPIPRGASIPADSAESIMELAKQWAQMTGSEVVWSADEGALFSKSGSTHTGKDLESLLARARHWGDRRSDDGRPISKGGLGTRVLTQRPTQIPGSVYEFATRCYLFRVNRQSKVRYLEDCLDVEGLHAHLQALPEQFAYCEVVPGRGIV